MFIQYRTENLRVVPVFGKGALDVSPRIGHLHITVDDAPWHFVDSDGGDRCDLSSASSPVLIRSCSSWLTLRTRSSPPTVTFTVPDHNKRSPHE